MRCIGCGYQLIGLPEPRCPECGRAFDPADPGTFSTKTRSGRRELLKAIGGIVLMSLPLLLAWRLDTASNMVQSVGAVFQFVAGIAGPACMIGGFVLEAHVLDRSWIVLRRGREWIEGPAFMIAALFVSGLIVVLGGFLLLALLASSLRF